MDFPVRYVKLPEGNHQPTGLRGPSVIVPQLHQTLFATRDVVGTTLPRRGWSLGAENLVGLSNLMDMENATETNNET